MGRLMGNVADGVKHLESKIWCLSVDFRVGGYIPQVVFSQLGENPLSG